MTTTTEGTAPSTADVRAWAERRHLIEPGGRGRLSAEVHAAYANEMAAVADAGTGASPEMSPGAFIEVSSEAPVTSSHAVPVKALPDGPQRPEGPPEGPPRKSMRDRLRLVKDKSESEPGKPRRARKRVSLETLGGLAWVGVSRVVAFAGDTYLPVVKMMSFQAPVAGAVVEDLARGTVADRIMQPVARLTESGGAVGALIGAPVLTAVVCKRPELYPQVRPMLMGAMREWVIVAGPKLREMRRREEKFAEEMGTFTEEFGVTVEQLLDEVFASLPGPVPPDLAEANGHPPA
jgi:hypothetical protein